MVYTRRRVLGSIATATMASQLGGSLVASPAKGQGLTADVVPRPIARVIRPSAGRVGDILQIQRTMPAAGLPQVDPFLMLDHFDFTMTPGERGGLAPHPHRGLETVTVIFEGALEHGDSLGNRANLENGDVQWMTAGSGIVHEENPADVMRQKGGRVHGVQLWVNLPSASRMIPPRYQDRTHDKIGATAEEGVTVRVLAGEAFGIASPVVTQTPLALLDVTLAPGSESVLAIPDGWTGFVQVVEGVVSVNGTALAVKHLAVLGGDKGGLVLQNETSKQARVLFGGGEPINQPIVRHGPFVLDRQQDVQQAIDDYTSGRMGQVANPTYDRVRLH